MMSEARRQYMKMWRAENKEHISIYNATYHIEHVDAIKDRATKRAHTPEFRAKSAARYAANPEYFREASRRSRAKHPETIRAYIQAHPDKYRAYCVSRRARKNGADINDLTGAQWQEIKAAYGHRCVYCGRKMQRLTMDHIIPLSKGGNHTVQNVVPACSSCNKRKHAGPPPIPVQPLLLTIEPSGPKK